MSTKLLLFDAAGVLFSANTAVGDSLMQNYNLSEQQLKPWLSLHAELSKGQMSTNSLLDKFASIYNIPRNEISQDTFTEPFRLALLPINGSRELLNNLSSSGSTFALLSNTAEMYANIID